MRVVWNEHSGAVALDQAWDSDEEPTLALLNTEGQPCIVRKTQYTGAKIRSEGIQRVYLWLDNVLKSDLEGLPEPKFLNNLFFARTPDEVPLKILAIRNEGKTVFLTVAS